MCNCEEKCHPGSRCGGNVCLCHDQITNYADDTPIEELVWADGTPVYQESNLVKHARLELNIINEEPEVIEGYLKIIKAFDEMGHSGASAAHAIGTIAVLLTYGHLAPLTDDPEEWMHIGEDVWGDKGGIWQSRRNPEAFSKDGGKTYKTNSNPDVIRVSRSKETLNMKGEE